LSSSFEKGILYGDYSEREREREREREKFREEIQEEGRLGETSRGKVLPLFYLFFEL
jgi:hypothetical protein